jgi:hypothetical protein
MVEKLFSHIAEINTISEQSAPIWKAEIEANHPKLIIGEDRDNADYLYERKSLVDLVGQSLHKKLAHVLHFVEDHPDRVLIPAELANPHDMVQVLDGWAKGRDVIEDYNATLLAIEQLRNLNWVNMMGAPVLSSILKKPFLTFGASTSISTGPSRRACPTLSKP